MRSGSLSLWPDMDSSAAKITLDQESFRALASDVRVDILKRLDVRRETVTDLSNLLSLSKPTLLEHLEKLQHANLVKRVDEGRKWIYYELSEKGRKILHPERIAITLALSAAVVLAAIGVFYLLAAGMTGNLLTAPTAGYEGGQTFPGRAESFASSGPGLGPLLIGFSIVALSLAFVLRRAGLRQRERFFEQLSAT